MRILTRLAGEVARHIGLSPNPTVRHANRLVLGFLVLSISGHAAAQLEEVIVTAQKREQALSDVPMNINALSGTKLDEFNIQQFDDLANFIPGLEVQEQSANNPAFVIRGITSDSGEANIEPRIAIFQDGVPSSRSRGSFFELHDLERVEVVKGPQSTLFGRAALIGGINVIQHKPEYEWHGQFKVGYGESVRDTEYDEVSGHIGGPIIDERLAFRASFIDKKRDPYVEDLLGSEGFNGADVRAWRVSLRADLLDSVRVDLLFNDQRDTPPGTGFKSNKWAPPGGDTSPFTAAALKNFGGFRGRGDNELGLERDMETQTAIIVWDINEAWSLTSISGWREFTSEEIFDPDGTQYEILTAAEVASGEQFSQELRLNYESGGKISTFFGLNYLEEEGEQYVPVATDQSIGLPFFAEFVATGEGSEPSNDPSGMLYEEEFANRGDTESIDMFWDLTWHVNEQFDVTVGIRRTKDDKTTSYFGRSVTNAGDSGGVTFPDPQNPGQFIISAGDQSRTLFIPASEGGELQTASDTFVGYSWRLVGAYHFNEEFNAWASYSRGRRPEVIAFNTPPDEDFVAPETLEAEIVDSIELGGFAQLFDGKANLSGSIFYYEYTNFQTTVIVAGQAAIETKNAGSADAYGLELQFDAKPLDNLAVFTSYGYNHGRFADEDDSGVDQEFAGNRFRLSPDHSIAVGLTWFLPTEIGTFSVTPTYSYKTKIFFDDDNDRPDLQGADDVQDEFQDDYGLLDLSVRFESANGFFVAELYGKNLLDEEYLLDAGNTGDGFGLPTFIRGPDKLIGMTVTGRF